ncbi:MAG: PAS domain-containing protein, partial [Pseudomonadota bacterium]
MPAHDTGGEARLSTLLGASSVILYTMDPANLGTMTWVSDNFARITGWDPAEVRSNPCWLKENIQPDDHARLFARVVEWLDCGAPETILLLYRQRTPEGRWRWYEDQLSALHSATGPITELVGSIQDVTERVEKERRMGKIAINLPGVLYQFRIEADGRMSFPYASSGIERIYGVSAETVMADAGPVFEALHPDDRAQVESSIAISLERLEPWRAQYRVCHPRLGTIWVEGRATPEAEADGATLWHGVIFDITEQKEAEHDRDRVLGILEANPEYVGLADLEGHVLYQNPALRRLIGDLDCEGNERPFIDSHPDWAARKLVEEALPAAVRDGTWQGETEILAADGRRVPVAQTVVAHAGPDGRVERFSTIMRDISDRRAAERERDRLLSILEATPDFVSMAEPDGAITYINRGGLTIMGLDPERNGLEKPLPDEVVNDAAGYLAHPEWATRRINEEALPAALAHGVWQGETAYLDHTGRELPASQVILAHYDEHGELDRFSTILRDMSEQRQLEEQLRTEKELSDAILRNLPGVFY